MARSFKMIWLNIIIMIYIATVNGEKLHEHMTEEEIQTVFNVKPHEIHKLNYEVVPIYHKNHDTMDIKLRAFRQFHDLKLEENDNVLLGRNTIIWKATKKPNKYQLSIIGRPYPVPSVKLYHDLKNRAAIAVHKGNGRRINFDGVIGDYVTIRHIPSRIHNEVLNKFPHLVQKMIKSDDDSNNQVTNHVIIKSSNNNSKQIAHAIVESDLPSDTVYPQLLLTVDYETFRIHNRQEDALAIYMAAFWNSVDLRFRELHDPRVRLNIASLIILESEEASFYFRSNNDTTFYYDLTYNDGKYNSTWINGGSTLRVMGTYFNTSGIFLKDSYDIVVGITSRNISHFEVKLNSWERVLGLAFPAGACHGPGAVALLADKGRFDGVDTAAHEIAHSLNALHDMDPYLGSEDIECPKSGDPQIGSYIMGTNIRSEIGFHFSNCSIKDMQKFLNSNYSSCLRNKPHLEKPFPIILPGQLLTRDEQCQEHFGENFIAVPDQKDCIYLWCHLKNGPPNTNSPKYSPMDGTPCDEHKICLLGRCVPK